MFPFRDVGGETRGEEEEKKKLKKPYDKTPQKNEYAKNACTALETGRKSWKKRQLWRRNGNTCFKIPTTLTIRTARTQDTI